MTVIAAAFCPHPPLLVPAVGAGEPVDVRQAAVAAVRALVAQPITRLVVIGSGASAAGFPSGATGSFAGYGVDLTVRLPGGTGAPPPEVARLPLSLAVGAWLLAEVGWSGPATALACDPAGRLPAWEPADGDGLLVMGDGSARRSEKAPGWLDERAASYDAAVRTALADGNPDGLVTDLGLGADLLAAGAPVWSAAAQLLAGVRWAGQVGYDAAPYGVGYLVANWTRAAADPARP